MLKSLLQGFSRKRKASVKLQQRYQMNFMRGLTIINFLRIFATFFLQLEDFCNSKLGKIGQFFQISIHFHPRHPWRQQTLSVPSNSLTLSLTIRPVARKGYGSIAHEAKPNGLLTRGP